MRIKWRPHIVSNTNNTCQIVAHTQQYKRTCCLSSDNATPVPYIQPTKISTEPSAPLKCIWTAREGEVTTSYCIKATPITRVKFKQYQRTYCSSRANTTPTFNKRRPTQSRCRHFNVFGQHMMVRLRPNTAITPPNSSNMNVRPVCSEGQYDTRSIYSTNTWQRMMVRLRPHTASNTNNTWIQAI